MSNVTKKVKINKIKSQLAKLSAQLQMLGEQKVPQRTDNFWDRCKRFNISYETRLAMSNVKKKMHFLNRKLDKLEGN